MPIQPEFIYATLILPSLFAVTMIAEGINKMMRRESGWVSIGIGVLFLFVIVVVYFGFLRA